MSAETSATRLADLRKLAKARGWTVSSVKAAPTKRRAPIDMVATRLYRKRWTPGNMSHVEFWERIEVVDDHNGKLFVSRKLRNEVIWSGYDDDVLVSLLTTPAPADAAE